MQKIKEEEKEAIQYLRKRLKPGSIVYTEVTKVARSGMSRHIRAFIIRKNERQEITWRVAQALDRRTDDYGIVTHGCGMDMGFETVYALSRTLYPKGFNCAGEKKCRSNDHFNGDRDYSKGKHHSDGGYALVQKWL